MLNCVCVCVCSFFSENQYPDEAKREEIAIACNAVINKPGWAYNIQHNNNVFVSFNILWSLCVRVAGKKLSDLERVTSLKVYNWFANRRKDIKRRANIGNVYFSVI